MWVPAPLWASLSIAELSTDWDSKLVALSAKDRISFWLLTLLKLEENKGLDKRNTSH